MTEIHKNSIIRKEMNEPRKETLMKTAVLFDLDGTLWDSSAQVAASWDAAIRDMNLPYHVTQEMMYGFMGRTMNEIAYMLFDKEPKDRAVELLRICTDYENKYLEDHGGILYDGLAETLAELKKEHFLAVISNCQEGYIEAFYRFHDMGKYFDDLENNGRTGLGKADNIKLLIERNNIERAVYVGDIMGDYESATAAGIPFIHAAYGFGTVPEGTPKIDRFTDLPAVANRILTSAL